MSSWERKALTFINQTGAGNERRDISSFMSFSISLLRELTGAYMSLQLAFEDSYTVRVKGATPSYLDDLIFHPGPIDQLLQHTAYRPVYWTQIPEKNAFEDLFQALSSAVIIPVRLNENRALIVLGWSETLTCDPSFREFMDVVRIRIEEIFRQIHTEHTYHTTLSRYSSVLNILPEGLIFIGADGYSGWVNQAAATLLHLGAPGDYPPAALSGAMGKLISQSLNKEEIQAMALQLFSSPDSSLENMQWKMEGGVWEVSCFAVEGRGKVWRIRTIYN